MKKYWPIAAAAAMLMTAPVWAAETPLETFVEDDNCSVCLMNTDENGWIGYEWKLYLENKTDIELMFSMDDVYVNGLLAEPFWASSLKAGMNENSSVDWIGTSFKELGIDEITDVEFRLRIYDSNNWEADSLVDDVFHYYPLGEESKTVYVREKQDTDLVLWDDENCTITLIGYDPDDLFGFSANMYLENKTDKKLMFSVSDAAVNGFMCDPYWAEEVVGGKSAYANITWFSSSLEEQGITEVETISMPFSVYDSDDWFASYLVDETFTLTP